MFHLFFDLTVNNGWNGVALATYAAIIILTVAAIKERKGQ